MEYDIDLSDLEDMPERYRYSGRNSHHPPGTAPFWKLLALILVISNIGLWAALIGIYGRLDRVMAARSSAGAGMGTLVLGQEVTGRDPVEEDSIRNWEAAEREAPLEEQDELPAEGIRKVYLTFDDGPSKNTGKILDILDEYGVKATFFVVAEGKSSFRDYYKRIVDEGHTLGMHSYTHVYKDIYSSREAFIQDISSLQEYLYDITGVTPGFYRFPGGSSTSLGKVPMTELESYIEDIGLQWIDWNISSGDATGRLSADDIFRNSTAKLENYSEAVILFHDAAEKSSTVEALPRIIEYIQGMEDTVILPVTDKTAHIQHRSKS